MKVKLLSLSQFPLPILPQKNLKDKQRYNVSGSSEHMLLKPIPCYGNHNLALLINSQITKVTLGDWNLLYFPFQKVDSFSCFTSSPSADTTPTKLNAIIPLSNSLLASQDFAPSLHVQ